MKKTFFLLALVSFKINSISQNVWAKLSKTPTSNVVGQLVIGNGLSGNGISPDKIITYEGASSLITSSSREWSIKMTSALSIGKFKCDSATFKNIKIDAINDKDIFNESKYYENFFVYRAKRADSVYFNFTKKFDVNVKPSEILSDSLKLIQTIKDNFPNLDSLQIISNSKNSIKYMIANPKVYFEAEAIQFKAGQKYIIVKNKFQWTTFFNYENQSYGTKAFDTLLCGQRLSSNIDFKGGIMFTLMTMDQIETNPQTKIIDTICRLGIGVSETYKNEFYYSPMPFMFKFDPNSIRMKKYFVSEDILLTTSDDDRFLAVYLTLDGTQHDDRVIFPRHLSGSSQFYANRLDYIILKMKRYSKKEIQ